MGDVLENRAVEHHHLVKAVDERIGRRPGLRRRPVRRLLQDLDSFRGKLQGSRKPLRLLGGRLSVAVHQEGRIDRIAPDRLAQLGPAKSEPVLGFECKLTNFLAGHHR